MSYEKLPVSSLEARAAKQDQAALTELQRRSAEGLRRATLALERLHCNTQSKAKKVYSNTVPEDCPQALSYPLDHSLIAQIEREQFARYGDLTAQEIHDRERLQG